MIPKDYVLPRPIKQVRRAVSIIAYKRRENEFLLERNAQFDSLGTLANVAFENEHHEIRGVLMDMRNTFAIAGYTKNNNGIGPAWSNSLFEDNAEFAKSLDLDI